MSEQHPTVDQKIRGITFGKDALRMLWPWLKRARLLWIFLGSVIVITWVFDWVWLWFQTSQVTRFQYTGWVLQLLGLGTAVYGLDRNLKLYTGENTWDHIRWWLYELPILKKDVTIGVLGASMKGHVGAKTRAILSAKFDDDASLEEKVEFLLQQYDRLQKSVHTVTKDLNAIEEELLAKIDEGKQALSEQIQDVDSRARTAHIGDLGWTFVGFGWIAIGMTWATVPNIVYQVFRPLIEIFTI